MIGKIRAHRKIVISTSYFLQNKGNFACKFCEKTEPTYKKIAKHIDKVHFEAKTGRKSKKKWTCYYCQENFPNQKILIKVKNGCKNFWSLFQI